MPEIKVAPRTIKARVSADLRTGFCEKCGTPCEKEYYFEGTRKRVHKVCPKCGGLGKLIVRTVTIDSPGAPQCASLRCISRFWRDSLRVMWLASYHNRRVKYALRHRNNGIPEKFRTGEPAPKTITQAVIETLKLIWRK